MLPAYVAYHLRLEDDSRSTLIRLTHGALMGLIATMGFVTLFGAVGLGIAAGGYVLISLFPYWGLGVGAVLVVLGVFLLFTRRKLEVAALSGIQGPKLLKGVRAFFLFGIAYGLASLSCTLPIFLVVVGSALAAGGFLLGLVQFVSYAIGMGTVMIILTLAVVFFKTGISDRMIRVIPYMQQVGSVSLIAVGLYLIHYWTFGTGGQELLFV